MSESERQVRADERRKVVAEIVACLRDEWDGAGWGHEFANEIERRFGQDAKKEGE